MQQPAKLLFLVLFLSFHWSLKAQLPPDFFDTPVLTGLEFPTGITFDERGYAYIWEKRGQVFIMDTTGQRLSLPLIDIQEEVTNWNDHGLLGFCLDNNFLQNGYIYLLYSVDWHHYENYGTPSYHPDSSVVNQPTFGRVTRYQATASSNFTRVDPDSKKVLLGTNHQDGIPILFQFHGLGSLIQSVDGSLLISSGDATANGAADIGGDEQGTMISRSLELGLITEDQDVGSYRSQYLGNLNGKILRIDPETGEGLTSNPFFETSNPRSAPSRIWSLGLRNPYRITLEPETASHYPDDGRPGHIWIGDVGNGAWEELSLASEGGQNFGWPIFEGNEPNWAFMNSEVPLNQLAANPLYNTGNCDHSFFNFRNLIAWPHPDGYIPPTNPCNGNIQIPPEANPMVNSRPIISWSNAKWNGPTRAQLPGFDEFNNPIGVQMDAPNVSVTGEHFDGYSSLAGVFYTGTRYPEQYHQQYFHVDYSGWIKVFRFDEDHHITDIESFHAFSKDIIHLAYNPWDEALYYINISGHVRKISYGGNQAPIPQIIVDRNYGPGPLTVNFDGRSSVDPNGDSISYFWDFGDGQSATGPTVSHTFGSANNEISGYTVRLEVSDELGLKSEATVLISPNNTPPVTQITSFADGDLYPTDRTTLLSLRAEAEDAEHSLEELGFEWRIFVHHNDHFHPEPADYDQESFYLVSPLGCDDEEEYWYEVRLKVTDPAGLSSHQTQFIYPNCESLAAGQTLLEGEALEEGIKTNWQLLANGEISRMELQRSYDYFHFDIIQTYDDSETELGRSYAFLDEEPGTGTLIYRLKLYGENGQYDYSNLITLSYPVPPEWRIYPNPGPGIYDLELQTEDASPVHFELFSLSGQRLRKLSWPGVEDGLFKQGIRFDQLAQGVYFYRIKAGNQEYSGKLIKE